MADGGEGVIWRFFFGGLCGIWCVYMWCVCGCMCGCPVHLLVVLFFIFFIFLAFMSDDAFGDATRYFVIGAGGGR